MGLIGTNFQLLCTLPGAVFITELIRIPLLLSLFFLFPPVFLDFVPCFCLILAPWWGTFHCSSVSCGVVCVRRRALVWPFSSVLNGCLRLIPDFCRLIEWLHSDTCGRGWNYNLVQAPPSLPLPPPSSNSLQDHCDGSSPSMPLGKS